MLKLSCEVNFIKVCIILHNNILKKAKPPIKGNSAFDLRDIVVRPIAFLQENKSKYKQLWIQSLSAKEIFQAHEPL
jgi:hypothetical protein